jgi:hypothetical protein
MHEIRASFPSSATAWYGSMYSGYPFSSTLIVYAICANAA